MSESEKETLQDSELENVSGGYTTIDGNIHCECCGASFYKSSADRQTITNGQILLRCPSCRKWIQANGRVWDPYNDRFH